MDGSVFTDYAFVGSLVATEEEAIEREFDDVFWEGGLGWGGEGEEGEKKEG